MITVEHLRSMKGKGQKISMLTAYDFPTANIMDEAGIDVILVGDSLANVVLGLNSTREVGMLDMLHHSSAVARAVKNALVVGDMPYGSYQIDHMKAVANAKLFIDEAKCHAVKIEWFDAAASCAAAIVTAGVPVMGHVGLTPQTSKEMKVQGRMVADAQLIVEQAFALQQAGCFAVVLECVPCELAALITQKLSIPTIGIGAGLSCDGQVLVSHDVLGLASRYQPKFSKKFTDIATPMSKAFKQYIHEVKSAQFPDDAHSFHMNPDEFKKLQ